MKGEKKSGHLLWQGKGTEKFDIRAFDLHSEAGCEV